MSLTPDGFQYLFLNQRHNHYDPLDYSPEVANTTGSSGVVIQVNFINANREAQTYAIGEFPEYYNYFIGSDASRWSSGVAAYQAVLYSSFYEGIDLKVYSQGEQAKYDFIVKPYANAGAIRFAYAGVEDVAIRNGDLEVVTPYVTITEKKPVAYQWIDGMKVWVPCAFAIHGGEISFQFPEGYDDCYELIIDPLLIFSTYSGSRADNWGSSATPAEHGRLYSAGATLQDRPTEQYPATPGVFQNAPGGYYDVGILKYDSAGKVLLYASYLGGAFAESAHSLVMDSNEDLIILGTTSSLNLPVTASAFQKTYAGGVLDAEQVYPYAKGSDIFVARISRDGKTLKGCTYLGGSANDGLNPATSALYMNYGDGMRGDIITDTDHNVYFSSVTSSTDFPSVATGTSYHGGLTDAILVKMNPDLSSVIFSAFMGGDDVDAAHTLKLDAQRNIFVGGGTQSINFPTTADAVQKNSAGGVEGWIAKVNQTGASILHATYTGRSEYDQLFFLDLDPDENIYVFGQTTSSDFIKFPANVFSQDNGGQFVQKFSNALDELMISTVFGAGRGVPDISPTAFLVNDCQNIFLAGWGGSLNNLDDTQQGTGHWENSSTDGLSITPGAIQARTTGNDFYLAVLDAGLTKLTYGTFFGGRFSETHVDGGTSRFDKNGIVYQAVCASCGGVDNDYYTTPGAYSSTNNSRNCNNLAFKLDLSSLKAILQTNSVELNMPGIRNVCFPDTLVFENLSIGGQSYVWDMGDGRTFTASNRNPFQHFYKAPGIYTVWLKAIDAGTCKVRDSVSAKITVDYVEATVSDDVTICEHASATLEATGGGTYHWTTEDGSFDGTGSTVMVSPTVKTEYHVVITDNNSPCTAEGNVVVDVIPLIVPEFEYTRSENCFPLPAVIVRNTTVGLIEGDVMTFNFGDGFSSDDQAVEHTYKEDGVYTVKLTAQRDFCISERSETIPAFRLRVPNVITPKEKDGINDVFQVLFGKEGSESPIDYGFKVSLVVYNRWGKKVFESKNYRNDWSGDGVERGVYFFELDVEGYSTCKSWVEVIK